MTDRMAPDTDAPASLMAHLKESTAEAHRRAEAVPFNVAVMGQTITQPAYVAQLHAYQVLYQTLHHRAANHRHGLLQATWRPSEESARLQRDIDHLDPRQRHRAPRAMREATRLAEEITAMALSQGPHLFGALYVLKGAGLGGLVMTRHLQQALGLQDEGLHFYGAQPRQRSLRWKQMVQRANAYDLAPDQRPPIVASARVVFDGVGHILQAIGDYHGLHEASAIPRRVEM